MKKLLELLSTIGLSTTTVSTVVACDIDEDNETNIENEITNKYQAPLKPKTNQKTTPVAQYTQPNPFEKTTPVTQQTQPNPIEKTTPVTQQTQPNPIQKTIPVTQQTQPNPIQKTIPVTQQTQPNPIQKTTPVAQHIQSKTRSAQNNPVEPNLKQIKTPESQIQPTNFFNDKHNNNYFITDIGLFVSDKNSAQKIKIANTNNSNIWYAIFDSKNNLYFASYSVKFGSDNYGELYVLKNNTTSAIKIQGINRRIHNITIDNNDNVYLDTDNGLFVLKESQTTAVIESKVKSYGYYEKTLGFDFENNLYFKTLNKVYILKQGQTNAIEIKNLNDTINDVFFSNNNDRIYFATKSGVYFLEKNSTTAIKLNELDFLNKSNKANYIFIDNNKIYIGCLHHTYILDLNHTIINKLNFDSHRFQYDDKDNIYFGTGRGLYKFEIATGKNEKINIKTNQRIIETDEEVTNIYFIDNKIYFRETTRQNQEGENFYQINDDNLAIKIDRSSLFA